jgi:UDP-N-acetyl-D-mannosaminuronate dehydrogenase
MNIAVVGLGFVGLSISSVLASKNYNVVGIDIDNQKCSDIRNGVYHYLSQI